MRNKINVSIKDIASTKFDDVPFVEGKTEFQLKTIIKNIWANLGDLATAVESSRPDIANAIDSMRDNGIWSETQIKGDKFQRYQYMTTDNSLVLYDRQENVFRHMDENGIIEQHKAMTQKEVDKTTKQRKRAS